MKDIKAGNIKVIGIAIVVIAFASVYEYTDIRGTPNKEQAKDMVPVEDIMVTATGTPVVKEYINRENTKGDSDISDNTIKANRPRIISGVNIELLGLATGEDIALVMVDEDPYQIRYNTETEIKGFIIKVTDPDYSYTTAKISIVKSNTSP